jgi:hypothetical protein
VFINGPGIASRTIVDGPKPPAAILNLDPPPQPGGFFVPVWTVARQAHVDAHASRESTLWIGYGYTADNSVEAVLRI